jgi:hypothetical protein
LNGSSRAHDALVAASLANLSLIELWNALINYSPAQSFWFDHAPSRTQYAAALANVFLIGFVFFLLIRLARWIAHRYGSAGFIFGSVPILILTALPAAKAVVRLIAGQQTHLSLRLVVGTLVVFLAAVALIARRRIFAIAAAVLITLSPIMAVEATLSVSRCWPDRTAEFANAPTIAPTTISGAPRSPLPRIVWIIFDELDYRLSFTDRPSTLALPEFDRLRAASLFAENAVSPANDTAHSVPSLLTGKNLAIVAPQGPRTALLDGATIAKLPTIFSSVRGKGGSAAVDGWYIPYCRVFAQDLAACSWHEIDNTLSETKGTFAESVALQQQSLFEYGYLTLFPESLRARHRIRMLQDMLEESKRYASDPSLDFIFLHLPVPHPPHFYDRASRTFTRRNAGAQGYADSLALADVFLGEIRASMTRAGLWDHSTVLVSSDHPNRTSQDFDGKTDPRVPFILKLAGQTSGLAYHAPVHTVITKSLLEAILNTQINTAQDAATWLQIHQ